MIPAQEIRNLVKALKHELRLRGISYHEVASALNLSEASVKRLFSNGRFTLDRLAKLGELLGLSLAELIQHGESQTVRLRQLATEQEAELVSDPWVLLVAVCVLNHWTVPEIVENYRLTEAQCLSALLRLDRLGLITLLPGNRVRLRVARDFDWLPDGPIRKYFREQRQDDFLGSDFAGEFSSHAFTSGMLTDEAARELQALLQRLRRQFEQLHQESLAQPLARRFGTAMLLATRRWEPPAFTRLRRTIL